jgi:hypothetical protein
VHTTVLYDTCNVDGVVEMMDFLTFALETQYCGLCLAEPCHAFFAALAGIKDYLTSKNRHHLIWGQDWQPNHSKDAAKMAS